MGGKRTGACLLIMRCFLHINSSLASRSADRKVKVKVKVKVQQSYHTGRKGKFLERCMEKERWHLRICLS